MMRSMYSAVSSLKAHQLKMDVIGNNIANVNTVGFKGSRVTFQEVFSQTLRGAGRPQEGGRGGTNPQQVGLGVGVSSMDTFHMRGSVETTGYNTDLMINGDGFFMVSDTSGGANKNYTRAGNFGLDTDGNLVTPDGYYVLGYQADENGVLTESLTGLKISKSLTSPPKATEKAIFEGNIDSNLAAPVVGPPAIPGGKFQSVMKVHDTLGNAHNIEMTFERTGNGTGTNAASIREFTAYVSKVGEVDTSAGSPKTIKLYFNSAGELCNTDGTIIYDADNPLPSSSITISDGTNPNDPPVFGGTGTFKGAEALNIKLDFNSLKSYSKDSDAAALKIDGYASGKLEDFTISANGEIEGVFSNGDVKLLGQVRLANFKNPAGLLKTGSNMYRETSNSGEAIMGSPGTGGFANLQPGALEMSNVDLSREFTDMIVTQRGFQANSRIITTSDEMLQEIVNIKR